MRLQGHELSLIYQKKPVPNYNGPSVFYGGKVCAKTGIKRRAEPWPLVNTVFAV